MLMGIIWRGRRAWNLKLSNIIWRGRRGKEVIISSRSFSAGLSSLIISCCSYRIKSQYKFFLFHLPAAVICNQCKSALSYSSV